MKAETKGGLSQEGLKLIACITMLLDHIGAVMVPGWGLRAVGRLAFPIYCFLLTEGAHYTRSPKKYALRLGIAAMLSEIPFDLALFGSFTWAHQNVMLTLLLGLLALLAIERISHPALKILAVLPFALLAEGMHTDYGGAGVAMIALFRLSRELPVKPLWQLVTMSALILLFMPGYRVTLLGLRIPIELFAVFALIPISCYHGKKHTANKGLQWAFYLFYPVHLTVIFLIHTFLR